MNNSGRFIVGVTIIFIILQLTGADIRRDCRKQTNVSWSALKKLKAGNFDQGHNPNNHNLKCYLRCFMIKNGIMGANNDVDVEKVLRHLPPGLHADSKKILTQCKNLPSTDVCDKAFQIVRCYFKFQPEERGFRVSQAFVYVMEKIKQRIERTKLFYPEKPSRYRSSDLEIYLLTV